jgi:hypothetical protein
LIILESRNLDQQRDGSDPRLGRIPDRGGLNMGDLLPVDREKPDGQDQSSEAKQPGALVFLP